MFQQIADDSAAKIHMKALEYHTITSFGLSFTINQNNAAGSEKAINIVPNKFISVIFERIWVHQQWSYNSQALAS